MGLNLFNNRFSPHLGIRGTWQKNDLKIHATQVISGLGEVTFDTRAQFKHDRVEGIAGADFHIWGPLLARAQATFNDSNVSVLFKIIYGFSWVDP
jgi:hypothetical protein